MYAKNHTLNIHDVRTIMTPKIQMRKLWPREIKCPALGHTARITAPMSLTLKPGLLISKSNISKKGMSASRGGTDGEYKTSRGQEGWVLEGGGEGSEKASWRRRHLRWAIKDRVDRGFLGLVSQFRARIWGLQLVLQTLDYCLLFCGSQQKKKKKQKKPKNPIGTFESSWSFGRIAFNPLGAKTSLWIWREKLKFDALENLI